MKREFHAPLQLETFQGDGGTLNFFVKCMFQEKHTGGSYDMNEFQQGTRQHVTK